MREECFFLTKSSNLHGMFTVYMVFAQLVKKWKVKNSAELPKFCGLDTMTNNQAHQFSQLISQVILAKRLTGLDAENYKKDQLKTTRAMLIHKNKIE